MAKIAVSKNKPSGFCYVPKIKEEIYQFLDNQKVGVIPGIGLKF